MSRGIALLILAGTASGALSGCAVGRPGGASARANSFCQDASTSISKLKSPGDPKSQIQYAMGRYAALDKTVSELTDSSLPSGATGAQLRQRWLQPARGSLRSGRATLARLQNAVEDGDSAAASAAFAAATRIGTDGVDTRLLSSRGLTICATLFTPKAP